MAEALSSMTVFTVGLLVGVLIGVSLITATLRDSIRRAEQNICKEIRMKGYGD